MAYYIVNEWFWSDLFGDNGDPASLETLDALLRFANSPHTMVVIAGSASDRKAWALCTKRPRYGRLFVLTVRQNSDRCLILRSDAVPEFPMELAAAVKDDDRYLIQGWLAVPGSVLVTTDKPLISAVEPFGVPCIGRGDFIALLQS